MEAKALRQILDHIPSSVAVYTLEGRLVYCNHTYLQRFGAGEAPEGRPFLKAGRRESYQISRLPEAAEELSRDGGEQSDLLGSWRRRYVLLDQGPEALILEILSPAAPQPVALRREEAPPPPEEMILSDRGMRSTLETIRRISTFDSTVLITGESGTGKTMLAKYIHTASRRARAPFVTINCGTIPENLIESELFGYVSGAFTGAGQRGKVGLVETANGGTLFLDEIGTLPLNLQRKFLQLVQEKTYLPVGGVKPKTADVRIISATNLDLHKQVEEGVFREDLYYRLRVIEFHMPPLRERKDAMDPLIDYFLSHYNRLYQLSKTISPKARDALKHHSWDGNIRELQYVIERAMVTSADDCIQSDDIPPLHGSAPDGEERELQSFDQAVEGFEKKLLRRVYQTHDSSYKLAKALGLSQTRASRLLRKYDIR